MWKPQATEGEREYVKKAVNKEELVRMQEEDSTSQKFKKAKESETRKGGIKNFFIKNVEEFGVGYVSERIIK